MGTVIRAISMRGQSKTGSDPMKSLKFTAAALIFAALANPAAARSVGLMHSFNGGMHGTSASLLHPNLSISAPANPMQAQMQDDYATQLQTEQRELLQQNPSGTTRDEITIGNQLNGFTPR
jgi:hypothetical protein